MLSADGDIGDFGLTARTTRYGKALALEATAPLPPNQADLDALGPDDQWLGAKWITDVELRYKLFEADRSGGRREQSVRRLSGPARRSARGRMGGFYPQNFQYINYSGGGSPFGFNGRFLYATGRGGFLRLEARGRAARPLLAIALMPVLGLELVAALGEAVEHAADRRMVDRLALVVGDEVLLADISDVARLAVLGEQMVEGLVLVRADRLGDRLIPFVASWRIRDRRRRSRRENRAAGGAPLRRCRSGR